MKKLLITAMRKLFLAATALFRGIAPTVAEAYDKNFTWKTPEPQTEEDSSKSYRTNDRKRNV